MVRMGVEVPRVGGATGPAQRIRVTFMGRVQGVGFRPAVFRVAQSLGLVGFVRNTPSGVVAEVEGPAAIVDSFVTRFSENRPVQARVDRVETENIPTTGAQEFRIEKSSGAEDLLIGIPPDLATCGDCVRELFDPADRRFRYPFINCTSCGPRFSIVTSLPYDRDRTSMSAFQMCAPCRAEYEDVTNRRFDAQPDACAVCGPALQLLDAAGRRVDAEDPVRETARLLHEGAIVAIKSLGGYHLCCRADDDAAVAKLRERKRRPAKSLAVMCATLDEAARYVEVGPAEAAELASCAASVVVLPRRAGGGLSKLISPDTADVGVFLPYTPLHHLLLREVSPLVMTSGNLSEEPIVKDEAELARLLGPVADYALIHDRPIARRCDDSVMRLVDGERLFLRRSRGWVPGAIPLPVSGPSVLACGAELKNTFCITRGAQAFVSQHIGNLDEHPAYQFFEEAVADWLKLLEVSPALVAHDMHPDYLSTRFAQRFDVGRRVAVQHHHAHVAACMAEHGLTGKVIGVSLDGAGFGPDGSVWGGEFMVADLCDYQRVGHLQQYRLVGGDEAVRHPSRMAFSVLVSEFGPEADAIAQRFLPSIPAAHRGILADLVARGIRSPLTSSAGRLFDAVSALMGLCDEVSYEGQAAIRLQTVARTDVRDAYSFGMNVSKRPWVLSTGRMFTELLSDLRAGIDRGVMAARFHRGLAAGVASMCEAIRNETGLVDVALSGGVFQNHLLLRWITESLKDKGFSVHCHRVVPPNDGGVSLGQAVIALARAQGRKM